MITYITCVRMCLICIIAYTHPYSSVCTCMYTMTMAIIGHRSNVMPINLFRLKYIIVILISTTLSFVLTVDVTEQACGSSRPAVLTSPGEIIQSPSTNNVSYDLNQRCHWHLKAPDGSVRQCDFFRYSLKIRAKVCWLFYFQVVQLHFHYIEIEWNSPCEFANISVYDSEAIVNDLFVAQFCANATAPKLYSSASNLLIVFLSGRYGTGRGFEANFTFIPLQG